jgi:hypothetical protein
MKLPELPWPFRWAWENDEGKCIKQDAEDVAWFWRPGHGVVFEDTFECVSSPVDSDKTGLLYRVPAETEEEAINLIVSFALLGIRKDE